ncbi:MAG: gliding motility-associated C-terminal domain-containing protein, partial [Bacteroidales bacterium]|nr:gliding motility-associated C-terminal domain-containing protein [Bacteroidales bacterium]
DLPLGYIIADELINHTDQPQTVTYTITPVHPGSCNNGPSVEVIITIEPTPRLFTYITNDTLCNNDHVIINFASPTTATLGIDFNMRIINDYPEISGYSPDTDRMNITSVINENINNTGDTARMIMYIFTPFTLDGSNNQKCEGLIDTVRVWINPTPRVIPVVAEDRICYGDMTEVQITTPTVMTHGLLKFDYTVILSGAPGDLTGNQDAGPGQDPGDIISFPYENNTDTVQSVFYSILPRSEGTACAAGLRDTAEVKVHPLPLQELWISQPLTCDSNSDLELTADVARGTEPLDITWSSGDVNFDPEAAHNQTVVSDLIGGAYTVVVTDNIGCVNYEYIEIQPPSPPGFAFDQQLKPPSYIYSISCYGGSDGEISVNVWDGQNYPYIYWIVKNGADTVHAGTLVDAADNQSISGLDEGIYDLILLDDNGCFYYSTTPLEMKTPPIISAGLELSQYGAYNISCKEYSDGEISIVSVSGGNGYYKYFWYSFDQLIPGDNTLDRISGLRAGTYYLEITDTLGCQRIYSRTLTEPEGISLQSYELSSSPDGNFNISCYGGNDGYIDLTFEGGSGEYSYEWFDDPGFTSPIGQTTAMATNLTGGTYWIVVTDLNGCSINRSYTLTEPDSLEIGFASSLTYDGLFNIECNGGTGFIDITVSGGSPDGYFYEWSGPDGSGLDINAEDQPAVTAGWYIVKVTDANGCIQVDSIELTEPPPLDVELVVTDITCESAGMDNGSIDLTVQGGAGEPYSYSWTGPEAYTGSVEDPDNLIQGWYYLTVTDDYGCIIEDSAFVANPPPLEFEKDSSNYNAYGVHCYNYNDGFINITMTSGEEPYIFTWEGPDGFSSDEHSISDLYAGVYILNVTDNNLCTVTDTTHLTQPAGPLIMNLDISESDYGGFNINCYGDSTGSIEVIPQNNVGTVSYYWTDGYRLSLRTDIPAGTYGIMIRDVNYCYVDTIIELTQPDPIMITAQIDPPFCKDMPDGVIMVEATGGYVLGDYSYSWDDNTIGNYRDNVTAGQYWLTVTDDNECSRTEEIIVESEQESCLTIPNAISPDGDGINEEWIIGNMYLYNRAEVRIFNRWGVLVWASDKGYPQPWDGTSNGRKLPVDTYHYVINLHDGTKPILGNVTIVR